MLGVLFLDPHQAQNVRPPKVESSPIVARVDAQKVQIPKPQVNTTLLEAIEGNKPALVASLVAAGANVESKASNGLTCLHTAVHLNLKEIVEILLRAGADVNGKDKDGHTPLQRAVHCNCVEIAELLIDKGASTSVLDKKGHGVIHWAYTCRFLEMYEMLCRKGLKWNTDTGHERDEIALLAASWGIGGKVQIDNETIDREGTAGRNPPLWVLGDALAATESTITHAFHEDKDLDLTKRLDKIHSGKLVVIQSGWSSHSLVLVFYSGYLIICNRGCFGPTKIFKINPKKATKELLKGINKIVIQRDENKGRSFFYTELVQALEATQNDPICEKINTKMLQKPQKAEFCEYVSAESAVFNILALRNLLEGKTIEEAKALYKIHTTLFRFTFLLRYLDQIEDGRIKKVKVDWTLLKEIQRRLKDPAWHPERFIHFREMREIVLEKLNRALI